VTITGTNTAPASVTVPVTLTVQAATATAQLSVSPGFINESTVVGGAARQGQLIVSNRGGGTLSWTASQTGVAETWLSVTASGTATPTSAGTVSFTVNPGGLGAGTYTASIEVSAGSQSQTVPVTLVVIAQTETIVLPQSGLEFDSVVDGPAPGSQQFAVLNTGTGAMNWTTNVCTFSSTSDICVPVNGGSWLQATPGNGSSVAGSVSFVTVSVNPSGLTAGDYFGAVQVGAAKASNSPQAVTVQLHVLAAGQEPPPSAPSGAVFVGTVGGAAPVAQSYMLTNAGAGSLTFNSTSTQSWLTLTPASGSIAAGSGATVSLSVNAAGLTAGVQEGTVWVAFSDGTIREISVALVMVSAGASSSEAKAQPATTTSSGCSGGLNVTLSGSTPPNLNSNSTVEVGTQPPVSVQVTNCSSGAAVTSADGSVAVTVTPNGPSFNLDYQNGVWEAGWPVGGTTGPVTVTVTAFVLSLSSETQLIGSLPVTVNVVQNSNTALAQPMAVLNAASYPVTESGESANNITPGSWAAIFGTQMADKLQTAEAPFPTVLDNVTVTLGGQKLPLHFVNPMQVNALIPWKLNASGNQLYVVRDGTQSNPIPVTVVNAQPAIFTTNQKGSGQGAVLIANTATIAGTGAGEQPAPRGGYIEIYCTGLGAVSNTPADGAAAPSSPLAKTLVEPQVSIGGENAPVTFSGLAPGFVGLYQVDALVPTNAPTGTAVPIVITVGTAQSPSGVTIAVQ
jgi:uncharacterized protein (TIGR03437 family)